MQLPNADVAVIEEKKIVDYLLNPKHPDGGPKAFFFDALGFRVDDRQKLAEALRQLAVNCPVTKAVESLHGQKYIIEGVITSPLGKSAYIRTVWIADEGCDSPRLVTAYPCEQV